MLDIAKMPALPGQFNGRPVETVAAEALASVGVNGAAFALHTGDIIEFPAEPLVIKQRINSTPNSPEAYYVAVVRNGQNSWLSVSSLTRRDAKGQPLGKFQEDMLKYPSFKEIYEALAGKKIRGGAMKEHEFAVFENGQRTEKTRTRSVTEIEYA
jgi:hypothetical protein